MQHNREAVSSFNVCPVCNGTGWVLSQKEVEGYAGSINSASPCTACSAERRIREDHTGVPPQYCDADLRKFDFAAYERDMSQLRDIMVDFLQNYRERWVKSEKGLYLWSKTPGSGKTFLACCLAKSVMVKHDLQMRFVTVPDYLAKVGESYKRQPGESDESAVYRECDLLIFDDIGTQKTGEWQEQEVFRIINERLNAGKITIFTSNQCPEDLYLSSRIVNRITKKSIVLQMPEVSIRQKQAKEEQARFLQDILHIRPEK